MTIFKPQTTNVATPVSAARRAVGRRLTLREAGITTGSLGAMFLGAPGGQAMGFWSMSTP
eukprot:CAMPEP_0176061966 /NCGR_PEP_ID=MMETSP0120_2-20121206/30896_1 /TAXON_ID=160619 /ORGANISM="Kryptoperidinium foliaceum, Strain CCMP 1326" /LENGTH=59 /DNA_ID=CAMNT_0017395525 /DNA_START=55 /DNA_END=231 /DNA_ORIENTATION=-